MSQTSPATLALDAVLGALAGACQSDRAALQARKLGVCATREHAELRCAATEEALVLLDSGAAPAIPHRLDHRAVVDLAARAGVVDGEHLRAIGLALRGGQQVREAAERWPERCEQLATIAQAVPRMALLAGLLCDSFDERGELLDDASPELARLRAEVRRRSHGLRRRIAEMVKETDADGLLMDDYYTVRDGRFVLPVKASDKRVLDGIVHGSSNTGQTVYLEPREMVEANNALSLATDAVKREERRILAELSSSVGQHADAIEALCESLAALDEVLARGRLARRLGATCPVLGELADGLRLRGARHPKLVLAGGDVIANDVQLDAGARWLIVSGPNGGGKTVLLTAVGLACEMARRGLHISAREGSRVPFVDAVHVVLGDAQDIDAGHSTFSGHLARLSAALEAAQRGTSLVLLDELASGTEPLAGSALARAILERFAELPCVGLATTHFEALKLLPLADERYANAALGLDEQTLQPTFTLRIGAAGSSSPLALAERMGLPPTVVERARGLLGAASAETEDTLARLREMEQSAEAALQEAERERAMAKESRRRLEEQRRFEKVAADHRIAAIAKEAVDALEKAKAAAKAARKRLRRKVTSSSAIDQELHALGEHAKVVHDHQPKMEPMMKRAPRREPATIEDLLPGAYLHHRGLGVDVQVLEVGRGGKRVRVKAGVMELDAKLADLHRGARAAPKPARAIAQPATPAPAPVAESFDDEDHTADFRTGQWTCDLRGMRAEEALVEVDRYVDRAVVAAARGICVVHGHGTGALRKAVTEHLRQHPHVLRSRLGEAGEGGAGATMVWIARD